MRVQFLTAREAADLITDNSSIAINPDFRRFSQNLVL